MSSSVQRLEEAREALDRESVEDAARDLLRAHDQPATARYVCHIAGDRVPAARLVNYVLRQRIPGWSEDLSPRTAFYLLVGAGFVVSDFRAPTKEWRAVPSDDESSHPRFVQTSATPTDEALAPYRGQWVAMANGEIIANGHDLSAVVQAIRQSAITNDRLFFVADEELSEFPSPTP